MVAVPLTVFEEEVAVKEGISMPSVIWIVKLVFT